MTPITKGKGVTLAGLAIATIGNFALSPDVQQTFDPKYAPYVSLLGTLIATVGPSLFHKK